MNYSIFVSSASFSVRMVFFTFFVTSVLLVASFRPGFLLIERIIKFEADYTNRGRDYFVTTRKLIVVIDTSGFGCSFPEEHFSNQY